MTKIEIRSVDVELTGAQNEDGKLVVEGYVNKTGQWSKVLGQSKRFVEQILPGTFQRALDNAVKVDFYGNHDPALYLASTKNSSLELNEDEIGLHMRATISATSFGKDIHTQISDGLLTEMSFGFSVNSNGDNWERLEDGTYKRSISDINLVEVSVVRDGAYAQTQIAARSFELVEEPEINEAKINKNTGGPTIMDKDKQLKELRAKTAQLENEVRADEETATKKEVRTVDSETQVEMEMRELNSWVSGKPNTEFRALTSVTANNVIATAIAPDVIKMVNHNSRLLPLTKQLKDVTGNFEYLKQTSKGTAAFVGEMTDVPESQGSIDKVQITQKRVGAHTVLTQQLINDSGIDIIKYSMEDLIEALGDEMDKTMLLGPDYADADLQKKFQGLVNTSTIDDTVAAAADKISVDELIEVFHKVPLNYRNNGHWVMANDTFIDFLKEKDGVLRPYFFESFVTGAPEYKLFGRPIMIQDHMPAIGAGNRSVLFGDFSGYVTATKKEVSFKRIDGDTTQALRGSVLLLIDFYADGKVVNEKKFRFIKHPAV